MAGNIGGGLITRAKVKEASVSLVVTRADGRVEDLGVVSYYHRNPLKRLAWRVRKLMGVVNDRTGTK